MAVYLAWTSERVPAGTPGPWEELRVIGPGLTLLASRATLSRVYHELKWALAEGVQIIVVPVGERPKLSGLPPGTTSWLRDQLGS